MWSSQARTSDLQTPPPQIYRHLPQGRHFRQVGRYNREQKISQLVAGFSEPRARCNLRKLPPGLHDSGRCRDSNISPQFQAEFAVLGSIGNNEKASGQLELTEGLATTVFRKLLPCLILLLAPVSVNAPKARTSPSSKSSEPFPTTRRRANSSPRRGGLTASIAPAASRSTSRSEPRTSECRTGAGTVGASSRSAPAPSCRTPTSGTRSGP